MTFSTWEQLGKRYRAKKRVMRSRYASTCPQCKKPIAVGDLIGLPYALNEHKVNKFSTWYCDDCAECFQRGVDCGYLAGGGPWLNISERETFEQHPEVKAWLAEVAAKKAKGLWR